MASNFHDLIKIPNFKNAWELRLDKDGDEKKALLTGKITVMSEYKKEGEKYYSEEPYDVVAFGKSAINYHKLFGIGSAAYMTGRLIPSTKYINKDGEEAYSQVKIRIDSMRFTQDSNKGLVRDESEEEPLEEKTESKSSGLFAKKKSSMLFKK